jgi:hypothetical protein
MNRLPTAERTPLWHYVIYFFAVVFAITFCYIFGGKISFDIVADDIIRIFSPLKHLKSFQSLLTDIRLYAVLVLALLIVTIGFIRENIKSYVV